MPTATRTAKRPAENLRRMFADNMRSARASQRLTQVQLSKALGWSQSVVSDLENGKRTLNLDQLATLAKVLGTTPVALISPVI